MMKWFIGAALRVTAAVLVVLQLSIIETGAQRERSLSLISSIQFGVNPLPSLCPGSIVNFTCIAVDFPNVDWEKNGVTIEQYTPTSMVLISTSTESQCSVVLNNIYVMDAFSADFNTTLIASVNEGISSGDNITCGNKLLNTSDLIVNYTTISSPPVPPINMNAMEIKSRVSNSVEITIIFDTAFSRDNNVESYCIRSQGGACPNDSCVSPNNNYSCDGLEAGGEYIFTIRAINCGNQNGEETEVFSVTPRVPSAPFSCEVYALYNQSSGTLFAVTTLWTQLENPHNITSSMTQNVLFYNITYTPIIRSSMSSFKLIFSDMCGVMNTCNYTLRNEKLIESGYSVSVAASNLVGSGNKLTCHGQIDYKNSVFSVSTSTPSFVGDHTTVSCQFTNSLASPNITRQCQLCYSTLVDRLSLDICDTRTLTLDNDRLATFTIELPSSSGGSYGPYLYQVTAWESDTILSVTEGQIYTGCSPLQLGSVSTPEVNSRCITLMSDGSQLVEGIMEDNIIFCYNSEATLQGSVAVAYCDEGYDRVGPERVTCGSNGSWGNLPRCLKMSIPFADALLVWNIFLIIIGVVTWFIAAGLDAAGLVVLLLLVREKFNANFRFWHGVFILLLLLAALLLVISAALWIALGVIVRNYDRQGSIDTFSIRRDSICISTFALTLSAMLSISVGLLLTKLMPRVLSSKGSADITLSEDNDQITEKVIEETPTNGESVQSCHPLEKDRKGELTEIQCTSEEQPLSSENRKMQEDSLESKQLSGNDAASEPEKQEVRGEEVTKTDLSIED